MSDDRSDRQNSPKAPSISVFRPGQPLVPRPADGARRAEHDTFSRSFILPRVIPARVWESLNPVVPNSEILVGNGLFPNASSDPAAAAFDILRTRLLQALAERGWRRVAVTSPTHGCGKSFVATNLALSLARRPASRTVLVDLELRRPSLAGLLGISDVAPLQEFLRGDQPLESQFRRIGHTLALGLNGVAVTDAADLLLSQDAKDALASMLEQLDPEVVIYDMPPALVSDDVIAMAPQVDAILLVADGTRTSPADIRACERLFEGRIPLMGVVLNRAQDRKQSRYRYGQD